MKKKESGMSIDTATKPSALRFGAFMLGLCLVLSSQVSMAGPFSADQQVVPYSGSSERLSQATERNENGSVAGGKISSKTLGVFLNGKYTVDDVSCYFPSAVGGGANKPVEIPGRTAFFLRVDSSCGIHLTYYEITYVPHSHPAKFRKEWKSEVYPFAKDSFTLDPKKNELILTVKAGWKPWFNEDTGRMEAFGNNKLVITFRKLSNGDIQLSSRSTGKQIGINLPVNYEMVPGTRILQKLEDSPVPSLGVVGEFRNPREER